jgi:hypothetical protein
MAFTYEFDTVFTDDLTGEKMHIWKIYKDGNLLNQLRVIADSEDSPNVHDAKMLAIRNSAKTKFVALGFTEDEINQILNQNYH